MIYAKCLENAWQVMFTKSLLIHLQKICAHTHTPKGHFLEDTHIFSQSLELNFCDNSPPRPNNSIHKRKERRHNS